MKRAFALGHVLAGCIATLAITSAGAGPLAGQTLGGSGFALDQSSAVVGPGVEFSIADALTLNFDGSGLLTIVFPHASPISVGNVGSYVFTDLNHTIAAITGFDIVSLGASTRGITAFDLAFTADSISIDLSDSIFAQSEPNTFKVSFAPNAGPVPVPEPASLALLGLGMVVLGTTRFRRRNPKGDALGASSDARVSLAG